MFDLRGNVGRRLQQQTVSTAVPVGIGRLFLGFYYYFVLTRLTVLARYSLVFFTCMVSLSAKCLPSACVSLYMLNLVALGVYVLHFDNKL